jgi:hypothetical protein
MPLVVMELGLMLHKGRQVVRIPEKAAAVVVGLLVLLVLEVAES